ncbi:hypothetical protein IW15_17955 [Chryseobacterium soli]|uniref:Uncharacterized protein n=1 Tax=Chryseobacterium soli TaxID=445961 RepID=A0A086A2Y2_9FLAO|nr:DUF2931 family protein [Chryseobacterium soli]KFF11046.1 hypothetical protein IW15_17955 [Chryseobacterium soli]
MKLNTLNTIYVFVISALLVATAFKVIHYKKWERFYYETSVFAPKYHPAYLQSVEFLFPDNTSYYVMSDDMENFNSDWGQQSSPSRNDDEAQLLPEKLFVRYVSYREKAVYSDTIELPKEKMMEIFKKAKKAHKTIPIYYSHPQKGDKEELIFLIGIANNGNVLVALRGKNFDEVILKKHLKRQTAYSRIVYLDYMTRERKEKPLKDCFNELFEGLKYDTILKRKIDSGYEKNANYIDSAILSHNYNN